MQNTTQRHKWADVAIAFAEGKKIQNKNSDGDWVDWKLPFFPSFEEKEWRVKPDEPVVMWLWAFQHGGSKHWTLYNEFMTEKAAEILSTYPAWNGCRLVKVEGTRTEFPAEE